MEPQRLASPPEAFADAMRFLSAPAAYLREVVWAVVWVVVLAEEWEVVWAVVGGSVGGSRQHTCGE